MPPRILLPALVALTMLAIAGCDESSAKTKAPPKDPGSAGLPPAKVATPEPVTPKKPAPLPALSGPHFPVFDLLTNRPLAHRISGASFVSPFHGLELLRLTNANYPSDWMPDVVVDKANASAVKGRIARMWLPAWRPGADHTLELQVHSSASGANDLTVEFNGHALEKTSLKVGWQTVALKVPSKHVRGENALKLTFSNMGRVNKKLSGGSIAWVRLGRTQGDAAPNFSQTSLTPGQPLSLAASEGVAWHLWALPGSKLSLKLEGATGCGVSAEVFGAATGKVASVTSQKRLLVEGRGSAQETMVDLSPAAGEKGQVVRVELVGDKGCKEPVKVASAAVVVPGERPKRPAFEPPKYVLFWMIDTLRADHLKFYNPKTNVETPALQELVDKGAMFKVAFVQGNESKVSHTALFAGMYPSKTGVKGKNRLTSRFIMPEAIKKLGWRTGAHISNGYISEPWGFVQGWDHYKNNLREGGGIDGMALARDGIRWAKANKDKKFFLYLGTIDPHVTYREHKGIIEKYDTKPYSGPYKRALLGTDLGAIRGGKKVSARDKERIKNLYKNEITYNDQAFAKVREAFKEMGIWDDTMVVVTADHGDEFWEHGSVGHGHNIHQELVHVPLLVYYPKAIKGGTVVNAGVDVLDVYPTIVDALGGKRPKDLQGKSVLPLIFGEHGGYPEPAIATRYLGHYTMQMERWKLYLRKGDYKLFDRDTDLLELTDVAAQNPLAARWLLDATTTFRAHRKRWDKATWGVPSNLSPEFMKLRAGK